MRPIFAALLVVLTMPIVLSAQDAIDEVRKLADHPTIERAFEIIEELEPTRRGLYGGAVGYISFNGNMDTAIAIRTLLIKDNIAYLGVGCLLYTSPSPRD